MGSGAVRAVTVARLVGGLRAAVGLTTFLAPAAVGRAFAGAAGTSAPVVLFARGFGARDVVVGTTLAAASGREDVRRRLVAAAVCDTADAVACVLGWRTLPRGHRAVALAVSVAPALVEVALCTLTGGRQPTR